MVKRRALDLGGMSKDDQRKAMAVAKKVGQIPKFRFTIRTKDGRTRYCYAVDKAAGEAYCRYIEATILHVDMET